MSPSNMETAWRSRPGSKSLHKYLKRFTCLATFLGVLMELFLGAHALTVTLPVSSILFTNQTLRSPGGIFELGFKSDSQNNFMLAVWYADPIGTVVWVADRNMKYFTSSSAILTITTNALVISDTSQGYRQSVLYNSTNSNIAGAYLQDSGNLVLLDTTNSILWQSFDTPTDTLLPGQSYYNTSRSLRAWLGPGGWDSTSVPPDWAEGRYGFVWDSTHHLALDWFSGLLPIGYKDHNYGLGYYTDSQLSTSAYVDSLGNLFVVDDKNVSRLLLNSTRANPKNSSQYLRRVTIDQDGGLRIYSWAINISSSWYVEADLMQNHCLMLGSCGPYAYCTYSPSTTPGATYLDSTISCQCPDGFQLKVFNNPSQGCEVQNTIPPGYCSNPNFLQFTKLTSIDYPYIGDYTNSFKADFDTCKQDCLTQCMCGAFVYSFEAGVCWLKSDPIYNGYAYPHPNYGGDRNTYLKIKNPYATFPDNAGNYSPSNVALAFALYGKRILIVAVSIFIIICFGCIYCFCCSDDD